MDLRPVWLILLFAALPSVLHAQAVVVSPKCGTSATHFVLGTGGWPVPAKCDSCQTQLVLLIDGQACFDTTTFGSCLSGFSLDLHARPTCNGHLFNGLHEVRVEGGTICQGGPELTACMLDSFTVAGSVADPWIIKPKPPEAAGTPGDTFLFVPNGACGFPPCDTVHLIQVVRETGIYASGRTRYLTAAEQAQNFLTDPAVKEYVDSLDAWTTDTHFHIDLPRERWKTPYMTLPPIEGAKFGRTEPPADTARFVDMIRRSDRSHPAGDSVRTIALDCEINAFCAAGAGRGQYLGRCTWHWERTMGSSVSFHGNATIQQTGLAQPSPEFIAAIKQYLERTIATTKFRFPTITPPEKGGVACPP